MKIWNKEERLKEWEDNDKKFKEYVKETEEYKKAKSEEDKDNKSRLILLEGFMKQFLSKEKSISNENYGLEEENNSFERDFDWNQSTFSETD